MREIGLKRALARATQEPYQNGQDEAINIWQHQESESVIN